MDWQELEDDDDCSDNQKLIDNATDADTCPVSIRLKPLNQIDTGQCGLLRCGARRTPWSQWRGIARGKQHLLKSWTPTARTSLNRIGTREGISGTNCGGLGRSGARANKSSGCNQTKDDWKQ